MYSLNDTTASILNNLSLIRSSQPLIHCITNYVSAQLVANTLLALGASPVMAYSAAETAEAAASAGALVLNTGTPDPARGRSMIRAARTARNAGLPVVLDPAGAGISSFRRKLCASLLPYTLSGGIRANASEILVLAGKNIPQSSIDSSHGVKQAVPAGMQLLGRAGVVLITGEEDIICTPDRRIYLSLGHPLMKKVTGMGCACSAVFGAFLSIQPNPLEAALSAAVTMGVAGAEAGEQAKGPGSFTAAFLDSLSLLTPETIQAKLRTAQLREEYLEKEE